MTDMRNNLDPGELAVENSRLSHVIGVISRKLYEQEHLSEILRDDNVKLNQLMWDDTAKAIYDFDDVAAMPLYLTDMQQMAYRRERNARTIDFLNRIIDSPWFARISFLEDGETNGDDYYIGIGNLNDDKGNILVIDWRADISSLYYDSDIGPASYETRGHRITGRLTGKRQYKISDRQIRFMFDSDVAIQDQLLIELLENNTSPHMKNIVSTIQREQNSVIKSAPGGVLVVSGPAGSGKTSVAMHRIAYLMYLERKTFNANSIIILSPNNIFNDYISDVLPSLGEDSVNSIVFAGIIPETLPMPEEIKPQTGISYMDNAAGNISKARANSIFVKSSPEFTDAMEKFLCPESVGHNRFRDIVEGDTVIFSAKDMEEFFYSSYPGLTIQMRMNRIHNAGYAAIMSWAEKESQRLFEIETGKTAILGDGSEIMSRCRAMVRDKVTQHLGELYSITTLNLYNIYRAFLRRLAKGRIPTAMDANMLTDAYETYMDAAEAGVMQYEDYCAYALAGRILGIIEPNKDILHVVIDEAQDYSFLQFRLLRLMYPVASFTCLGDPNQRVNQYTGSDNLSAISGAFRGTQVTRINLNKSFRSTSEISKFCSDLLGETIGDNVDRHGQPVQMHQSASGAEFGDFVSEAIEHIDDGSTTAVLCKNTEQCSKCCDILKSRGIDSRIVLSDAAGTLGISPGTLTVMPVFMAKGLEFDNVIIYDSSSYGRDTAGGQLLYTACTRALHRLYVNSFN